MMVMVVVVVRRSMVVVSAVIRRLMVVVLAVAVLRRPAGETEISMRSAILQLPVKMRWLRLSRLRPKH
jgi:hypothetical protein